MNFKTDIKPFLEYNSVIPSNLQKRQFFVNDAPTNSSKQISTHKAKLASASSE